MRRRWLGLSILDDQPQAKSLDRHAPAQNWMPVLPNAV
jgi:hypothetical protein